MSQSRQVVCFFEDIAHEKFITALIQRAAELKEVSVNIQVLNATHGSKVWRELREYMHEVEKKRFYPDILVVVIDSDCQTVSQVRKKIKEVIGSASFQLVCAVPNPHIERWYLEDQQALKQVLHGAQPQKLSYKCERDRYKSALIEAIRSARVEPLLGGAEYGEEIAKYLDPRRMDESFQDFWKELLATFQRALLSKSEGSGRGD